MLKKIYHMLFSWSRVIVLALVIFLSQAGASGAFKIGGLEFKDSFQTSTGELPLRGAGLKRFLSIRVVAVGLYLSKEIEPKDVLSDIPKSLEVIYLQNIPAAELQHATTKGIRLNVSDDEFAKLQTRIDQINSYYPSVRKMDRIRVTYLPGQGTTVELNGVVQGVVPGQDFGRAFFAIWVGDKPVDLRMKTILLGKTKQTIDEIND